MASRPSVTKSSASFSVSSSRVPQSPLGSRPGTPSGGSSAMGLGGNAGKAPLSPGKKSAAAAAAASGGGSPGPASSPVTSPKAGGSSSGGSKSQSGRVRVSVRLRPKSSAESNDPDYTDCVELLPETNRLKLLKNNWESEAYQFDSVLNDTASQKKVYELVAKPVVESVLDGYNGTIMAYGQTGTGKTYTLGSLGLSDVSQRGIMARAMEELLEQTNRASDSITVSYLQLYMENIQDLLDPTQRDLHINEDQKTGEVTLPQATTVQVKQTKDFVTLLQTGESNRVAANTKMNTESSRSHAILMVNVRRSIEATDGGMPVIRKGKLLCVDLAGSERITKSGAEGTQLEEAKFINMSLTALGKCINALAEGGPHVPTRESKLTRILKDSFGGSARTSLVVTIGPSDKNKSETASTTQFGQRAMKVENVLKVKEEFDYKAHSKKLQQDLDALTNELERREKDCVAREAAAALRVTEAEAKVPGLQKEASMAKAEAAKVEENLAALRRKHTEEAKAAESAAGEAAKVAVAQASDTWEKRIRKAEGEIKKAEEEAGKANKCLEEAKAEISKLKDRLQESEQMAASATNSASESHSAELSSLRTELEEAMAEIKLLKQQVESSRLLGVSDSFRAASVGGAMDDTSRRRAAVAKMFDQVGLPKILSLLETEDMDVKVHAVKMLANLAAEEMNQDRIVAEGGLNALLKLLGATTDETCRRVAAGAIANLAMSEKNQELIKDSNGVSLLVKVSQEAKDPQTLRMVAGALANLCGNDKVQNGLRDDGGLKALLAMADTSVVEVLAQVARGFANFAKCDKAGPSLLIEDGALSWLVKNANSSSSSVKRHVELALCHLAQYEVNADDLIAAGALEEIVRIGQVSVREDVRELATKVVANSPTFQKALAGGKGGGSGSSMETIREEE